MKPTRMFAVLIAAVCVLLLLPCAGAMSIKSRSAFFRCRAPLFVSAASANDNYPISVEQAKNSVRIFMNDLTLDPQSVPRGAWRLVTIIIFLPARTLSM